MASSSLATIFDTTSVHLSEAFLSWRRQFNVVVGQAGMKAAAMLLEFKFSALEACVTTTKFPKILAIQSQFPAKQRENLDALLKATANFFQAADDGWLHRHAFNTYKQFPDQTFRQFYVEIVKFASLVSFTKTCDLNKIRIVDQLLLMKVVFGSTDISAQRKLIKETDLTAIQIINPYESIQNF